MKAKLVNPLLRELTYLTFLVFRKVTISVLTGKTSRTESKWWYAFIMVDQQQKW